MKTSLLILLLVLCVSPVWAVQEAWAPGVSKDGGYPHASKAGGDCYMCWAATASNLIEYWQMMKNTPASSAQGEYLQSDECDSPRKSKVFETFVKAWPNAALGVEPGLYWYFSGVVSTMNAKVVKDKGGYWEELCCQKGYASSYDALRRNSYYHYILSPEPQSSKDTKWKEFVEADFASFVFHALSNRSLVALNLKDPRKEEGHNITLYGAVFDDEGKIRGVYIHDNNSRVEDLLYMQVGSQSLIREVGDGKDMPVEKISYQCLVLKGRGCPLDGYIIKAAGSLMLD